MPRFSSLFSSSSGNSTYLASSKTQILIDAGVTCKRLTEALLQRGLSPEKTDAIFITHEHTDHIKGIRVFCTKYKVPIYATARTIAALDRANVLNGEFVAYEVVPGVPIELGDLKITATETSHDAAQSCMYSVEFPDGRRACVATDMGYISPQVHRALCGSDLVLLESNHDKNMLMTGPYPFDLKKRVASDVGHLSNVDCAQEVLSLVQSGTTRFFLGHLSEKNNMPMLAYETTASELQANGVKIGVDCLLSVCKPVGENTIVRF